MEQDNEQAVRLTALDSFHTSQTGTVPARANFETHRAHADDLVKRGLAVEVKAKEEAKAAPEPQNKKAPEPSNKKK